MKANADQSTSATLARASSSRVLNLFELTEHRIRANPAPDSGAFFRNPSLNRAVIIKHRLSADDRQLMTDPCARVGTKIFVHYATDSSLDQSGKYMYLGQKQAADIFREHFGLSHGEADDDQRDMAVLTILGDLPSLDPFLLRTRLARGGFGIDEAYFRLGARESQQLRDKVIREFRPLAEIAFKGSERTDKLTDMIVSRMWDATDLTVLQPMIKALGIDASGAGEIFFVWKGFVYYKLSMAKLANGFAGFLVSLENARAINIPTGDIRQTIEHLRPKIITALRQEYDMAAAQIEQYDHAYRHQLIRLGQPRGFTNFLKQAPGQFSLLGASVAGIDHAFSTWRNRFGTGKEPMIGGGDFAEMLRDFAEGLPLRD